MSPTERTLRERYNAAFGAWIKTRLAEQKPERWTQQRLRDELAASGYEVKREWVNQVINGKGASDELRGAIQALLGPFAGPELSVSATPEDLASAIREQTAAINELVELLRPVVEDHRVRLLAAEQLLGRLSERAFSAGPELLAPGLSKGLRLDER